VQSQRGTSQHTPANFSASAICKVQLISLSCGSGVGAAEQMVERNAGCFIFAYLSKFNRKMLRV